MSFTRKFRRKSNAGKTSYVAVAKDSIKPDAGMNSKDGINHYFVSIAEFVKTMTELSKVGAGPRYSKDYCELLCSVDIMDKDGNNHTAPPRNDGYLATFTFTKKMLNTFADQIDKGSMSVRIDGVPNKKDAQTSHIEKFCGIDVVDCWGVGNNAGCFSIYFWDGSRFMNTDTRIVAERLRELADKL